MQADLQDALLDDQGAREQTGMLAHAWQGAGGQAVLPIAVAVMGVAFSLAALWVSTSSWIHHS